MELFLIFLKEGEPEKRRKILKLNKNKEWSALILADWF